MRVLLDKYQIMKLDVKDKAILSAVSQNMRQPISSIAKEVALSRQSVEYRLKQLQKNGIIAGSRTVINIKKLGYSSYHIFLTPVSKRKEEELFQRAISAEYVNAVISYSGKFSIEISIMARSPEEFTEYYQKLISGILVHESQNLLLMSTFKSAVLPEQKVRTTFLPKKKINYDVDGMDLDILKILSNDATISNIDLANKFRVSKDTVAYRIKNLTASGHIVEFRSALNYSVLGYSIHAILFKIDEGSSNIKEFEGYLKESTTILWATKTFGYYNYLVYVITKDVSEIHSLIDKVKTRFDDILNSYELLFAYRELKYQFMADDVSL